MKPCNLDRAQGEDLGTRCGHLEHLLVAHEGKLAGTGLNTRVGGEYTRHIGVDLTHIGAQRRGQCHGRGVAATTPERGDVSVCRHPLEPRDQRHAPIR